MVNGTYTFTTNFVNNLKEIIVSWLKKTVFLKVFIRNDILSLGAKKRPLWIQVPLVIYQQYCVKYMLIREKINIKNPLLNLNQIVKFIIVLDLRGNFFVWI